MRALFKKGVSQHAIGGLRLEKFTADDDYWDLRETAAHNGEELKARHTRHVEVADDGVGQSRLQQRETFKTIFRTTYLKSAGFQNPAGNVAKHGIVINDQNALPQGVRYLSDSVHGWTRHPDRAHNVSCRNIRLISKSQGCFDISIGCRACPRG